MYFFFSITEHLGSGEFGTVCKGEWHTTVGTVDVAVKMLNNKATERDIVRFLQEAAIMGQFRHPNIVRLHGVVTVGEPVSNGRGEGGGRTDGQMGGGGGGGREGGRGRRGERGGDWRIRRGETDIVIYVSLHPPLPHTQTTHTNMIV